MSGYPDTSFLCALYRPQANSPRAASYFAQMDEPLHLAQPLVFEFRQSTRWQAFLHSQDPAKGFSQTMASASISLFQANIESGALVVVPIDWVEVMGIAERLSQQHTFSKGYRAFDLLHVATALHLEASEFLTFDVKQSRLAELEGLHIPFGTAGGN